jgi:hypothetical protein
MEKFGSGKNIPDLIFENLYQIFGLKILKLFDADPYPGFGNAGFNQPELSKTVPLKQRKKFLKVAEFFQAWLPQKNSTD